MPKLSLLLALLFCTLIGTAQDWAMIDPDERHHFALDSSQIIATTIMVDSIALVGEDSIYYLNKVIAPCDTCQNIDLGLSDWQCPDNTCLYLLGQPQFLQHQVTVTPDGLWIFEQPDSMVFDVLAGLGETWSFDGQSDVTVTALNEMEVLGTVDSTKTFSVSDGRHFVLSKSFGLISAATPEDSLELTGLQTQSIGVTLPGFDEIFDFEVGDVIEFGFEGYAGSQGYSFWGVEKRIVIEVEALEEEVVVEYQRVKQLTQIEVDPGNPSTSSTQYSLTTLTETYSRADYDFLVTPPKSALLTEEFFAYLWSDQGYHYTPPTHRYIDGRWTSIYGAHLGDEFYIGSEETIGLRYIGRDELGELVLQINNGDFGFYTGQVPYSATQTKSYMLGLGQVSDLQFDEFNSEQLWLRGYVKDGDTTGIVTRNDIILTLEQEEDFSSLSIYPNPATDVFSIDLGTTAATAIRVSDIAGREVVAIRLTPGQELIELPCHDWKSGLYTLEVTNSQGRSTQKIVIR